jgi:UDP-glucuronate 4-epimerase
MNKKTILVTGVAGFIGSATAQSLLKEGYTVIGVDNLNDYYDVYLKLNRLKTLNNFPSFSFIELDIADKKKLKEVFANYLPNIVINLAAQAGVRYSIENPYAYLDSNLTGFFNVLENVKNFETERLVFASSSSVYGKSIETPYKTDGKTDNPISLYAATKKSNEVMAFAYSTLCKIPIIGLRFFTVYGPMGRPDMAYYKFTNMIANNEEITIYNEGKMSRDMTYIDDIVSGITSCLKFNKFTNNPYYEIFNLGNNTPISTWKLLNFIESYLNLKANYKFEASNIEVKETWADISNSIRHLKYEPKVDFEKGMTNFLEWYKSYAK